MELKLPGSLFVISPWITVFKGVIAISNAVSVMPGMPLEAAESDRGIVIHWPEKG